MIVYNYISDDYKTIYYTNISNRIISVVIKVFECFTDTLIFSNELDLHPGFQFYTYMPQAWKNRKVLFLDRITNELLLPLWIDGSVSIKEIDKHGYIDKLFQAEKNSDLQLGIHATLSEHFIDRKYGDYVDVEKGDVVIDIGFNYGVFAIKSLYNGASKVFGFEPNKHVFEICNRVYDNQNLVEVFNFGVSNKNDKVLFKQGKSSLTSSIYGDVEDYETSYEVNTIVLTDFLFFHNIDKVDFLKIDCEGSEYDIFVSIPDSILSQIKKIHVEFHYNDGIKVNQLIEKLEKNNFEWKFDNDTNLTSSIGMIYAKQKL